MHLSLHTLTDCRRDCSRNEAPAPNKAPRVARAPSPEKNSNEQLGKNSDESDENLMGGFDDDVVAEVVEDTTAEVEPATPIAEGVFGWAGWASTAKPCYGCRACGYALCHHCMHEAAASSPNKMARLRSRAARKRDTSAGKENSAASRWHDDSSTDTENESSEEDVIERMLPRDREKHSRAGTEGKRYEIMRHRKFCAKHHIKVLDHKAIRSQLQEFSARNWLEKTPRTCDWCRNKIKWGRPTKAKSAVREALQQKQRVLTFRTVLTPPLTIDGLGELASV